LAESSRFAAGGRAAAGQARSTIWLGLLPIEFQEFDEDAELRLGVHIGVAAAGEFACGAPLEPKRGRVAIAAEPDPA
jgi:hypothetical protein